MPEPELNSPIDQLAAVPSTDVLPLAGLLQYRPPASNTFDEVFGVGHEQVQTHWEKFAAAMRNAGIDEIARRWSQAQRLVHEHSITYSAYGDPTDQARPWELDAIPFLIGQSQWSVMTEGLAQRARLWNLVLADLYGPQHLIKTGVLPGAAIYSHPGFDLSYHGLTPKDSSCLQFYAADLTRDAAGCWRVLSDRTEAASGAGFALENRIVISRMLPEVFRDCFVQRLAPYFISLRETIQSSAPGGIENPRVVLLTQGPTAGNYFEDAYLARYLGYILVEADDLTVRNNHVLLKTLGGLLPIDVILRRPNSNQCDPLELVCDPAERKSKGVVGLLQAIRNGNVAVVNGLGSGLVESPIFMAFAARLCRALLSEDLRLPGIATWWCGEPDSLNYVLNHLEEVRIRPAFRRRGHERQAVLNLGQMSAENLARTIQANPHAYVAQEKIVGSTTPIWNEHQLQAAHVAWRAFLVASGDSYIAMRGGLARTSFNPQSLEASLLDGEGSKDTWVVGSEPVEFVSLLPNPDERIQLRRTGIDLPSRAADNVFWLGRNVERLEFSSRLLRTLALRFTNEAGPVSQPDVPMLLHALAGQGLIDPGYVVDGMRDRLPAIEQALPVAALNASDMNSLRSVYGETLRLASLVRDRLSLDSWRIVLRMEEAFKPSTSDPLAAMGSDNRTSLDLTGLLNCTNQLIIDLAAFSGLVLESTTRTQVFRFLDLGRRMERAVQITALIKSCFTDVRTVSAELLEAVLEVGDSLMTYRARYLSNLQLSAVLDLLLTDETNPRSLAFQLSAIRDHVEGLPRDGSNTGYSAEQRLALSMLHTIRSADMEATCQRYRRGEIEPLADLNSLIETKLPQLSNAISHRYLVHAGPAQMLAPTASVPQSE